MILPFVHLLACHGAAGTSDDSDLADSEVDLVDTGIEDSDITDTDVVVGPTPIIQVTPTEYDFGSPYLGCQLRHAFNIRNIGNADLSVTAIDFVAGTPDFHFDAPTGFPIVIAPLSGVDVNLDYKGLDEFADQGFITIRSNDPLTPEVLAMASGAAQRFGDATDEYQ